MTNTRSWVILLSQQENRQLCLHNKPEVFNAVYASKEEALSAAHGLAWTHKPQHPYTDQGRRVLFNGDHRFTVLVVGATITAQFNLDVLEEISHPDSSINSMTGAHSQQVGDGVTDSAEDTAQAWSQATRRRDDNVY